VGNNLKRLKSRPAPKTVRSRTPQSRAGVTPGNESRMASFTSSRLARRRSCPSHSQIFRFVEAWVINCITVETTRLRRLHFAHASQVVNVGVVDRFQTHGGEALPYQSYLRGYHSLCRASTSIAI
jgi:hypothetical protein